MTDFDDSLGGQTLGGDNNEDRFEKSLGDEQTLGDDNVVENLEDAFIDKSMKLEDLSERYTEEGVLGKGGMGEVLLATDTRLNRKVAIKRILGKAARSKTATQRFLMEAKSIAALNHNNIVQIYDYGRSTDGPFLIMECVQGGSLLDKCKEGPIELEEAVNIFSQLCDGLAKAHAANIIHRDIKPANVLMTEDGVPKLTDFGLAKDDTADTGMTMEGAVIGTLDFMPPEQRQGAHLTDHRSDLWSLAATFYQMLTGKSPKVINLSTIPLEVQTVLGKALEESKEQRFQSAREMRKAVQQAVNTGKKQATQKAEAQAARELLNELLLEAQFHEQAYDYEAGLNTLTRVPLSMKDTPVNGSEDTADVVTKRLTKKLSRLKELETIVREKVSNRDTAELLPVVNELLTLNPDRPEVQKFKLKLAKREKERREVRAAAIKQAAQQISEQHYDQAINTLNRVPKQYWDEELNGLQSKARVSFEQLNDLRQRIQTAVNCNNLNGLLPVVEECLALKAKQDDLVKLKQQILHLEQQQHSRNQQVIGNANKMISESHFSEALQLLGSIPEEFQTFNTTDLLQRAQQLSARRQAVLNSASLELTQKRYKSTIDKVSIYLNEIANIGIQDPQLQRMLAEAKEKVSASTRKKKLVKLGIAAVSVAAFLTIGIVIKVSFDAKAVDVAIANLDWKTVLELDPDNAEGLRLKAQADAAAEAIEAARVSRVAEKRLILLGEPITNTFKMSFANIPAGTFMMGSPLDEEGREESEHQHEVTISKSFYMQTTEVTQEQWKAVMGTEPWTDKDCVREGANYPATWVSWYDAVAFCEKLSEQEGKHYRLPTEAEWEYACRAGTQTPWSFGNEEELLWNFGWRTETIESALTQSPTPVGAKKANGFGLYDIHGNISEWCNDYFSEDYYKKSPKIDPLGPESGTDRILRGGSWVPRHARDTRSSARTWVTPDFVYFDYGFRVVREIDWEADFSDSERVAIEQAATEKYAALKTAAEEVERIAAAKNKSEAITSALANGDWETVLSLDPNNPEGLRLKSEAVTTALTNGDWETVLSLDPNNPEGLRLKTTAEKADALKLAREKAVAAILKRAPLTNTIGMALKEIPAGSFMMGSPLDEVGREENEHQHEVTISKNFYMQTTEVTQEQWKAVMGTEPWADDDDATIGDNYPAVLLSFDQIATFCEKLSEQEGKHYRLPTEAEWEYACRAGTQTPWTFGDYTGKLDDYAWYVDNSADFNKTNGEFGGRYTHKVGLKKPNAFGLYDMYGNVHELCQDYYFEDYYKESPEKDPMGPASGAERVTRGGSWNSPWNKIRSAYRFYVDDYLYRNAGFRVVRELD